MELSTSTLSALHTGPSRLCAQSGAHVCEPFLLYDTIDVCVEGARGQLRHSQNNLPPLSVWHRYPFDLAIPAEDLHSSAGADS